MKTSQRVQVFTDGIATPNSCVETSLSTDSRPETIITNVYVNTCNESRKKSTLSKLIRRRSKKRSHSKNSSGSNSVVYDEHCTFQSRAVEKNEERLEGNELRMNQENGSDERHENEPQEKLIGANKDEDKSETIQDSLDIAQILKKAVVEEKTSDDQEILGQSIDNEEINFNNYKDGETNVENNRGKDTDMSELMGGEQEVAIKARSKREANGEMRDDLIDREAENVQELETSGTVEEKQDEIKFDGEVVFKEGENRGIEVVEYAQVLTDKIIGSGEILDKLLAEAVKEESLHEQETETERLANVEEEAKDDGDLNFVVEGGETERNDETLSEGGLESEVPSPKHSERGSIEEEPNRVTFHDTDSNSLHESISADETVVASIDDPAAGKEEIHNSTTFEIRNHHMEGEEREERTARRKKSTTRGRRRNPSHCTHKYHFKQSFTTIQPLDLQHVRPKVDTGRSSSCTKSYSRSSDQTTGYEVLSHDLIRTERSLQK